MKKSSKKQLNVEELYRTKKNILSLQLLTDKLQLDTIITGWRVRIFDINHEKHFRGEIHYLENQYLAGISELNTKEYRSLINKLKKSGIPCFIAENSNDRYYSVLKDIGQIIPVFVTGQDKSNLIYYTERYLRSRLTPFKTVHGVLVDIHRVGVLILGKSGVGKSESALDLINKGSKLISDDVIEIRKMGSKIVGTGPENIKYLMEIRGVGIVNIRDLYGASSIMNEREIELVIELDHWDQGKEYDRLGLDQKTYKLEGVNIPYLLIPVSPGRNTSTIIDVAVRNQILKSNRFDKKDFDYISPGEGSISDK